MNDDLLNKLDNKDKDQKVSIWIPVVIVLIFTFLGYLFYDMHFTPCKPCGYVNYKGEVVPGYEVKGRYITHCFSCDFGTDPNSSSFKSPELKLAPCPKKYWKLYNEKAVKINEGLVKIGLKPKYELLEIK